MVICTCLFSEFLEGMTRWSNTRRIGIWLLSSLIDHLNHNPFSETYQKSSSDLEAAGVSIHVDSHLFYIDDSFLKVIPLVTVSLLQCIVSALRSGKNLSLDRTLGYLIEVSDPCNDLSDPAFGKTFSCIISENIERVWLAIKGDRRLTIRELENLRKDCVTPWGENDRVSRQSVTGFFTTITRQRIHWTLCSNF